MSDNWKITGQYFESCNCDLVCPCIFLAPPTEGFCEAFVGWHIEEGHLDGVQLNDIKVSAWLHSPGSLTDGNWKLALYIDDRATEEQKNAVLEAHAYDSENMIFTHSEFAKGKKLQILMASGLSEEQAKILTDYGICGKV